MDQERFLGRFVAAAFTTWRISHLLAYEDGPADLIVRLRARTGMGPLGRLMDCFQCLSLWLAAPIAAFVSQRPADLVLTWMALSGAACLLERLGHESITMQGTSEVPEGGVQDGMLRAEAARAQE